VTSGPREEQVWPSAGGFVLGQLNAKAVSAFLKDVGLRRASSPAQGRQIVQAIVCRDSRIIEGVDQKKLWSCRRCIEVRRVAGFIFAGRCVPSRGCRDPGWAKGWVISMTG